MTNTFLSSLKAKIEMKFCLIFLPVKLFRDVNWKTIQYNCVFNVQLAKPTYFLIVYKTATRKPHVLSK